MPKINEHIERGKSLNGTLISMFEATDAPTADHALAVLAATGRAEQATAELLANAAPKGRAVDSLLAAHIASVLYLKGMLERERPFKRGAGGHTVWDTGFRKKICSTHPNFESRFKKTHDVLQMHGSDTMRCKCSPLLAQMKALDAVYQEPLA